MSKYFQEDEVTRISFEDGSWVDVKQELTQADMDYITNKLMHAQGTVLAGKGENKADIQMDFGRQALLERAIVAWSFDVPVTPEHISALRLKYRSKVLAEASRLQSEAQQFSKN